MRVQVLRNQDALNFLDTAWPDLYRHDPVATPFQAPAWLSGWASGLPAEVAPVVLVAARGTGPVAALAFTHRIPGDGPGDLRPLSAPHAEYLRVTGPEAEHPAVTTALEAGLNAIAGDTGHIAVTDLPATTGLGRHLTSSPSWNHTTTACATVALPLGWAEMSRATRKTHKRRQRALDDLVAQGHQVVYHRSRTADELAAACQALVHLHRLQRADDARPGAEFALDGDAWRTVLEHCGPDIAFIAIQCIDETPIAAQLCLTRGARAYSLLTARHPGYNQVSPGHALLRRLIQDLTDAGYTALDLGRTLDTPGQSGYKSQYLAHWTHTLTATRAAGIHSAASIPAQRAHGATTIGPAVTTPS